MNECGLTGYTGSKYCVKQSFSGDPIGIMLALDSVAPTAAEFIDKAYWDAKINASQVFPVMGLTAWRNLATEGVYKDFDNESQRFVRHGKYRNTAEYDKNEEQKKQLQNLTGFQQKLFIVYSQGLRCRTLDSGVTMDGFPLSMFVVENETTPETGETPTIPIKFNFKDRDDLNKFDYSQPVTWVNQIEGLTEVTLAEDETVPTTATNLVLNIGTTVNSKFYATAGLVLADFAITGTGTLSSVSFVNGQYVFVTAGLINTDSVALVAPTAITDIELHLVGAGPVVVTGVS